MSTPDPTNTPTLVIEASNPGAGTEGSPASFVALGTPGGELLGATWLSPTRAGGEALHPAIAALCDQHLVVPSQLCRIAISVGPGGYTGLRVAVAAAVMLAEAVDAELVELATPELVAASAEGSEVAHPLGIALASKHDACHLSCQHADLSIEDLGMVRADDLAEAQLHTLLADRHLPESIRARAQELGVTLLPIRFDPAAACRLAARATPIEPGDCRVRYAREPDAVTQWRARHGGEPA